MFLKLCILAGICSFTLSTNIFEMTQGWAKEAKHKVAKNAHSLENELEAGFHTAEQRVVKEYDELTDELKQHHHPRKEHHPAGYHGDEIEAADDYLAILNILSKPRTPEKYLTGFRLGSSSGFSWQNCGTGKDIVTIANITLQPDKLVFPGTVTFSAAGSINSDMGSPISADIKVQKKIGESWLTIPCPVIGTCHYDDVCDMLSRMCPSPMPCKCPFKAGPIDVQPTTETIPFKIPDGDYKIHISSHYSGKEVFCLDITMAIG